MSAARLSGWRPMLTAFVVWFAHFIVCWAAAEFWPRQWQANLLAWVLTPVALALLGVHWARLHAVAPTDDLGRWNRRFSQGAIALAGVAIVFSAVPSLVFRP